MPMVEVVVLILRIYDNGERQLFSLLFFIALLEIACRCQFVVEDSTQHATNISKCTIADNSNKKVAIYVWLTRAHMYASLGHTCLPH